MPFSICATYFTLSGKIQCNGFFIDLDLAFSTWPTKAISIGLQCNYLINVPTGTETVAPDSPVHIFLL